MIKILCAFLNALILTTISFSTSAQWSPAHVIPDGWYVNINDVHAITAQQVFMCGNGFVAQSANGGTTWSRSSQFTNLNDGGKIEDVYFQTSRWNDVHFFNSQTGLAAGWSFVANTGIVIRTTDGGVTWKVVQLGEPEGDEPGSGITSFHFPSASTGFAVGGLGRIYKTSDGGASWKLIVTNEQTTFRAVRFFNVSEGVALAEKKLYKTSDGGATWSATNLTLPDVSRTFYFSSLSAGFVVDESGNAIRTNDGGATWTPANRVLHFSDFSFPSVNIGYGLAGGIYKTTDGGITWDPMSTEDSGFNTVHAFDNNNAWAATWWSIDTNATIFRTTNGGGPVITPTITLADFSPKQGLPGNSIIVTGDNMEYVREVIIGGKSSAFSLSNGGLSATVPLDAADNMKIELKTASGSTFSTTNFEFIKTPFVYSYYPKAGVTGGSIGITGLNLLNTTSVTFNGIEAIFSVVDNTQLTVTVPAGKLDGDIRVSTPFGTINVGSFDQKVLPENLSFFPTSNYRTGLTYINGTNLEDVFEVQVNGIVVPSFNHSDHIKILSLPAEVTSGKVTLRGPGFEVVSDDVFTVIEGIPDVSITSFAPTSGPSGQTITIYGTDFHSLRGLYLNGEDLKFNVISSTELVTETTYLSTSGKFTGVIAGGEIIDLSPVTFNVLPGVAIPEIESFTPAAEVFDEIIITGRNLYHVYAVSFGNGYASILRTSLTTLRVRVPELATSGRVVLYYDDNKSVQSSSDFQVIYTYCVPRVNKSINYHFDQLSVGNIHLENTECKQYHDYTDRVIEVVRSEPLSFYTVGANCNNQLSGDAVRYHVFVDYNKNGNFDDYEVFWHSETVYWADRNAFSISLANVPMFTDYRMRILVDRRLEDQPSPCDYFYEFYKLQGAAIDFTINVVNERVLPKPEFTAFLPDVTSWGETVSIDGQELASTERVQIDGVDAEFIYNASASKLEVKIPDNVKGNEVVILTGGGIVRVLNSLTVKHPPFISKIENTQDVVGATIKCYVPWQSKNNIERVFVNGVEANFSVADFHVNVLVPDAPTTGKVVIQNQFGSYSSAEDFTIIRKPVITDFFPKTAKMGEGVIITGSEFNGITEVSFNGIVASVVQVTPTQISVPVPYGSGLGTISVKNKAGKTWTTAKFTVLKSEAAGMFKELPSFNFDSLLTGSYVKHFDYNKDGLMDIVVSVIREYPPQDLTLYRNTGNSTFEPTGFKVSEGSFGFGDINGDGLDDIITGAGTIFFNSASGFSLANRTGVLGASQYYVVDGLDFDADGDIDIIMANTTGTMGWSEMQDGQSLKFHALAIPSAGLQNSKFIDLDNDGDLDFFSSRVYMNENGTFQLKNWLSEASPFSSITPIDFNGDGYMDMLCNGHNLDQYKKFVLFKNLNGSGFEPIVFGSTDNEHRIVIGDVYNSGTPAVLNDHWDLNMNSMFHSKFRLQVFEMPLNLPPYEKESLVLNNLSGKDEQLGPNGSVSKDILDLDNDGDLDFLLGYGKKQKFIRLFENTTAVANQAPSIPTDLTAEILSHTEVKLKWNVSTDDHTPANSIQYNVRVRKPFASKWTVVPATLGTPYGNAGSMREFYVRNLENAVVYEFEVQAIDMAQRASAYSPAKQFVVVKLNAPSLTVTEAGTHSVALSWQDNNTGEKGYYIQYKKSTDASFSHERQFDATELNALFEFLECKTSYDFRLRASSTNTYSDFSPVIQATTNGLPPLEISGNLLLCGGSITELTAPAGYASYFWSTASQTINTEVTYPGTYSLTVFDDQWCMATTEIEVVGQAIPVAEIEFDGTRLIATEGEEYRWYLDGELIANTDRTLVLELPGKYQVEVIINGCSGMSDVVTITVTEIERSSEHKIRVYPNPSRGVFVISNVTETDQISIINAFGEEVYNHIVSTGESELHVDLRSRAAGLYVVIVKGVHRQGTERIVIK